VSTEASKQRVRAFFDALVRADRAGMARVLAEDVTWVIPRSSPPPYAGAHRGRSQVIELMLGAAAKIFVPGTHRVELRALIAEGDQACAEVVMRARTPSGQDYENTYVFLFRFEGEQIAEFREHLDTRYAAGFLEL
jgi:ketosteroid isomerase-like protein